MSCAECKLVNREVTASMEFCARRCVIMDEMDFFNANSSVHEHWLSITSGPVAEEMLF